MADIEPQVDHLPGNFIPRSTAHPQYNHHVLHDVRVSLVRLDDLPLEGAHVFGHDVLQIPPASNGGQLEGRWEDVLPASAVERDVVQGTFQDPQRINVANYGIANYPEPSGVSEVCTRGLSSSCPDTPPATPVSYSSIHIFQCRTWSRCSRTRKCHLPRVYRLTFPEYIPNLGVPQENQGNDYVPQGVVLGPAQGTLPGPLAHRAPVLGQPAAENLRRLASRCVHHPDSQVDVVRMEPGTGGRYKVVIVLEMTDFL